jgi:voltage-gated potassium channel
MSNSGGRFNELMQDVFTDSDTPVRLLWQLTQGILVFASCLSMLLENYEPYQTNYAGFISALELVAIGFLTVDFVGNLYVATERIKYVFSLWGLVDLCSILPFYLLMLNPTSGLVLKCLRALRFLRLIMLWKIARSRF